MLNINFRYTLTFSLFSRLHKDEGEGGVDLEAHHDLVSSQSLGRVQVASHGLSLKKQGEFLVLQLWCIPQRHSLCRQVAI